MRLPLALVLLLSLAACDAFKGDVSTGADYDLTLRFDDGTLAARLLFTAPPGRPCDAIGCGSGEANWSARDVDPEFPLERASGVLYAEETGSGYRLSLTPQIADQNVTVEVVRAEGDLVTGTWEYVTIAGPQVGGTVEGRVE